MKKLTNPTQHLFNAWINWFVENDMQRIEIIVRCPTVISDGFIEELKQPLIRLDISAGATRKMIVNEDGIYFECSQRQQPVSVQVPWQGFISVEASDGQGTGFGVPFSNLEVNIDESSNLSDYDAAPPPVSKKPTLTVVK